MVTELGLDPNDPLNLLLHNSSQQDESSMAGDSSSDWSQISMWQPGIDSAHDGKLNPMMDLSMSGLGMDMDFGSSMSVDPSALQFEPSGKLSFDYDNYLPQTTEFMPANQPYPFTFQQPGGYLSVGDYQQRRLSITSSSSSSGASLSPILEHSAPVPSRGIIPQSSQESLMSDPADDLAQRVRLAAGVVHAVPLSAQLQANPQTLLSLLSTQQQINRASEIEATSPISTFASTPPSISSTSSAASTPPPSTPPQTAATLSSFHGGSDAPETTTGPSGRPKTSHTTIERRYRTNLNARIQSLRMAVPALRVLENQSELGGAASGARKVKVKIPIGRVAIKKEGSEDGDEIVDFVDERGFVDGVKVARKCSKANVLGKAVEYIRVLKKREVRLKREQAGLKSLISGLVGGPALIEEWEKEWRERFGGEEKDEIEGDDIDDGSDDDEDEDDDGEAGRKRKKAKIVAAKKDVPKKPPPAPSHPQVVDGIVVPEKRKRGRPRKVAPPPPPAAPVDVQSPAAPPPQQYLLAVFALFSFFNSPFSSSPPSTTHTGTVLTSYPAMVNVDPSWGWRDVVQTFHLIVSFLVFASIVLPWLPLPKAFKGFSFFREAQKPKSQHPSLQSDRFAELEAALRKRGSPDEVEILQHVLGRNSILDALRQSPMWFGSHNVTLQQKALEQRGWVRLAELEIMRGQKSNYWSRIQTYFQVRARLSESTSSVADLTTLALALFPLGFARVRAESTWESVKSGSSAASARPHEKLVLESLTLEEAAQRLDNVSSQDLIHSPMALLARDLVTERMKKNLETFFVHAVLPDAPARARDEESEERDLKKTANAARSLGGKIAELGEVLEKVWAVGTFDPESFPSLGLNKSSNEEDDEINSLLMALFLYQRVFPSSVLGMGKTGQGTVPILLSPPPSPGSQDLKMQYALRRALGSKAFEAEAGELGTVLEDARDRVVDMLVEIDRRGRRDEC